jgi:restriction system protein
MERSNILDVKNTTLDEWVELLRNPPEHKIFIRSTFPTDAHKSEWISTASSYSDADVKLLLRHFLVPNGSSPTDISDARYVMYRVKDEKLRNDDLSEHERHLIRHLLTNGDYPAWEGLGWVIDLLPQYPRRALDVIDAFFYASWQFLKDIYLEGLFDAQMVIRTYYIESAHTKDLAEKTLDGLNWRELEYLCGVIYQDMGYKIKVTPQGNDDGVDVFAEKQTCGQKCKVIIQAKKWSMKNPVGKNVVRELDGTINLHYATNGVLVTTGRFSGGALEMEKQYSRIELIDQDKMLQLLNAHCGADWYCRVDRMISNLKMDQEETLI